MIKLGAELRATPALTLRAGYAYNTQPITARDVMINILAPGVVQHHITGGLKLRLGEDADLELAVAYVPRTTVSGNNLFQGLNFGGGPINQQITIGMDQFEATVGVKYRLHRAQEALK